MKKALLILRILLEGLIGFVLACVAVHNIFILWPSIATAVPGYTAGYILGTGFFLILGIALIWDAIRITPRMRTRHKPLR